MKRFAVIVTTAMFSLLRIISQTFNAVKFRGHVRSGLLS